MGLFKRLSSFAPHYVLTTNNRTKFKDLPTLGVQGSTIDYNQPTEYRDIQLVDWEEEFGEGGGGGGSCLQTMCYFGLPAVSTRIVLVDHS